MASGNISLQKAKIAQFDEFYTRISDIEAELRFYKPYFNGKTVLCNCDDPRVSNFFRYFSLNFESLGLKKLIATCYKSNEPDLFSNHKQEHAIYIEYEGDRNGNRVPDPNEMKVIPLNGDGDFRSAECIELLKQADIVCTNPPFSLFREYVNLLVKFEKQFLIVGNQNALHYSEIFPLVKENKVWIGNNHIKEFDLPDGGVKKFGIVIWFTNLDIKKRHEGIIMYKKYTPEEYPKYDNFDGIDVGAVSDIPCDYYGNMGVPDSFLEHYNPDQFEIIGLGSGDLAKKAGVTRNYRGRSDLAITVNGVSKCPYSRILIRRK